MYGSYSYGCPPYPFTGGGGFGGYWANHYGSPDMLPHLPPYGPIGGYGGFAPGWAASVYPSNIYMGGPMGMMGVMPRWDWAGMYNGGTNGNIPN
jgi:hypothetical protein